MTPKFYILVSPDTPDAFFASDGNVPQAFDTEVEAVEAAKEYCGVSLVVKPLIRVTEKTTYKVEKIK